jgi:type IV pilus assembly protein PilM
MGGVVIGVDFGHASVKVAGLRLGAKPSLLGCKAVALDPQFLTKEGFKEPAAIAVALKEAVATSAPHRLPVVPCVVALSEVILFRKILELPVMTEGDDLRSAVRLQAAEFLPLPVDEMEVDYQVLGRAEGGDSQQVMVVGAPRKIIDDYLAVFKLAKLPLAAIDTKPAAVGRLLAAGVKDGVVLIDIGSELSTISIYQAGMVRVTSTVNMGGDIIKDAATGEVDTERDAKQLLRLTQALGEEVDHVLKFYANRSAEAQPVSKALLAGGGSMIANLLEGVAKEIGIPVEINKPSLELPPFCDRRFGGAVGAALYRLS